MSTEPDGSREPATASARSNDATHDAAVLALRNNQARNIAMLAGALDCIISMNRDGNIVEFNAAAEQTFGYRSAQVIGRPLADIIIPPALRARHWQGLAKRLATGEGPIVGQRIEIDAMRADGSEFPVELAVVQYELDGQPLFTGFLRDISARRRSEQYERFRSDILELLVSGEKLEPVLEALVRGVEQICPTMLCSILLLSKDGKYFDKSIAPSLPAFFSAAIEGPAIGLGAGSCGTAAFTGERVIVEDIATHAYWADYKELAARAGLAACWSQPIRSSSGQILGTFAIYHPHPHTPTLDDITVIEQSA
ncbi:MAG TPA: PAS domain S-box protein, partial [Spongiibacteraceae bacterium]|nr:PAS domain S-box protein [Spongiibacteraceae bacterium]